MHKEYQKMVRDAVNHFTTVDPDLLKRNVHEQSISHRIAVYLEDEFPVSKKISVDCEYNKHLDNRKMINIEVDLNELKKCDCSACETIIKRGKDYLEDRHFRPDIVVHHRGFDDNNEIVIEVKKDQDCPFDKAKLVELTRKKELGGQYGYKLGAFILFNDKKPSYTWFEGGAEVK